MVREAVRFPARLRAAAAVVAIAAAAPLLAAGRPSLNAYFQSTLKDTAYQKKTFDRVASHWKTPSQVPAVGKKTVVQARVARDGKLISTEVSMSSGVKAWDAAADAAVQAAAPFDPLPAGYQYPTLEVHFHVSVVP
jgi:TonB family protein